MLIQKVKAHEEREWYAQQCLENGWSRFALDNQIKQNLYSRHASIQHITKFLLELGKGFAFVSNQVPIEVDGKSFFIDMLFYNLKLRCFVVVEIKATKFKPEHAG